jgi:hypothetical protein
MESEGAGGATEARHHRLRHQCISWGLSLLSFMLACRAHAFEQRQSDGFVCRWQGVNAASMQKAQRLPVSTRSALLCSAKKNYFTFE